MPAIGTQRLEDLDPQGLRKRIDKVRDEGYPAAARGLASALRAFLLWAEDRGCVFMQRTEDDHYGWILKRIVARPRVRTLSDDNIRGVWRGIETYGVPKMLALAPKLILVTGRRPREVLALKWSAVDLRGPVWTVVMVKRGSTRNSHPVPLSGLAFSILETARVAAIAPWVTAPVVLLDRYVFSMPSGKPVSRQQLAGISRSRRELGNHGPDPWCPADLRATFRQRCSALRMREWVIDALINQDTLPLQPHLDGGWTDLQERRDALWERVANGEAEAMDYLPCRS